MNRTRAIEWIARGCAIAIVLAGILDPVLTVSRAVPPVVSVVSMDSAKHAPALRRLERALADRATMVMGALPHADARIVVGSRLPDTPAAAVVPTFILTGAPPDALHVEDIIFPHTAPLDIRVPVTVQISRSARGHDGAVAESRAEIGADARLELREDGALLARAAVRLAASERTRITLDYAPAREGVHVIDLHLIDRTDTLTWTRTILATSDRWDVLFYDPRPSWLSTFVRRAIAGDPRFHVASRTITSIGVSRSTTQATPSLLSLDGAAPLPDVVVVGAPEMLSKAEVSALERLLTVHGIAVILLPDRLPPDAAPAGVLWGPGGWQAPPAPPSNTPRTITLREPLLRDTASRISRQLLAGTIGIPRRFDPDMETVAVTTNGATGRDSLMPVIWRRPIGRGEVLVSGAFDAWRYRDRAGERETGGASSFEAIWRELVADAAQRRWHPVSIDFVERMSGDMAPHAPPAAIVRTMAGSPEVAGRVPVVSLRPDTVGRAGSISEPSGWRSPTLLPTAIPGIRRATWPQADESFESSDLPPIAEAILGRDTARAPFPRAEGLVDTPAEQLLQWARRTGGRLLTTDDIDSLGPLIAAATGDRRQRSPWHPMRSPWWILPLALAFGTEWWLRRRRGLP